MGEVTMNILTVVIEAMGAVLAAVLGAFIAGGYISKIFKKNIPTDFHTYSDESHDACKIMRTAKKSIYIVASIGDRFIERHEKHIIKYLEKGIKVNFLIHDYTQYYQLEGYINGDIECIKYPYKKIREDSLNRLHDIKMKFPKLMEIREIDLMLTASYIGIDIDMHYGDNDWKSHSVIQMMIYQYNVPTEYSPITYISPKNNRALFGRTAKCILEMWDISNISTPIYP